MPVPCMLCSSTEAQMIGFSGYYEQLPGDKTSDSLYVNLCGACRSLPVEAKDDRIPHALRFRYFCEREGLPELPQS